jgi:nucleoside-diphosphate-sugar epimerase
MENSEKVLVTGGAGFVGIQCVLQLLQQGYMVKTTLRSLSKKNEILDMLKNGGVKSFEHLEFAEADLMKDDGWDKAVAGCTYVLQVASPVFFGKPANEDELIRPAVEGIVRVLKAARDGGVKRVVMTSNFGAVGFSRKDNNGETTEADWTNPDEKGLSVYEKSKLLAERAAWNFIKREGGNLELSVINPVAILGPALSSHVSGSFMLLNNLLDGAMKAVPNLPLNIVDVRDVADLHIRAMTNPGAKGERFIASADGQISWPGIAALLKSKMPAVSQKVSAKTLPNWVLKVAGLFNHRAKEGAAMLAINRNVSNAKAKKVLGWKPLSANEQAIFAAVDSMVRYGIIK